MDCWFWNIDLDNQDYFRAELEHGRLRQGWGYEDRLDIRKLNEKVNNNVPLDDAEQQAWSRCNNMLIYIKEGNLIAVKNVPGREQFTLVRVIGKYDFKIDDIGDYGHILPIEIVSTFHKYSKVVPSPFASALNRARHPIIVTYKHQHTVCELATCIVSDEEKNKPETFKNKFKRLHNRTLQHLKKLLKENLSPSETEQLIMQMLRREGKSPQLNAGPFEQGADILCDFKFDYGLNYRIAVQVKMRWDEDYDETGIDQLETAFKAHKIHAGLLITMADKLGDNVLKRIKETQKKYDIQVLYGDDLYERLLELIADPDFELS